MAQIGDFNFNAFEFTQPTSFSQEHGLPEAPAPIQTKALYTDSSAGSPTTINGFMSPVVDDKLKAMSPPASDKAKFDMEEDKRRRNTAASARFRVKKKQREQALEKSAKEMADKVSAFEKKISQLETENKWLKDLIMQRNDSKDDIAMMWKKYNAEQDERKGTSRKDGVGTKA